MVKERRTFFLEFDIRNHFRMGPVKYYNVIGKIKGCKYPDEYVMASGHLDAFDVATGGVDCGSGVTPVMEAARMIMKSGAKPKRTMLFCAFAGEEFGLLGSTAWVKANKDKLDKISNLFNRDGGPTPPVGLNVPKAMYQDFVKICAPVKKIHPDYPFEVKEAGPFTKPAKPAGTDASVLLSKQSRPSPSTKRTSKDTTSTTVRSGTPNATLTAKASRNIRNMPLQ